MKRLPYAENLINLVVVEDLPALLGKGLKLVEVARVLVPKGVLCFGGKVDAAKLSAAGFKGTKTAGTWSATIKPRPEEMDEWTHPRHGPDANPVSQDTLVGLPERLQWIDGPKFTGSRKGTGRWISSNGRVFYVLQQNRYGFSGPERIIARDAFNGRILWKKIHRGRRGKYGHPLVAGGECLYTVLEPGGPLVSLDAASGEVRRIYKDLGSPGNYPLS